MECPYSCAEYSDIQVTLGSGIQHPFAPNPTLHSHITNPVHKQRNLPNERSTLVRPPALVLMLVVCALGPGLCSGDQPSFQTIPLQSGASVVAKYSVFRFRKIYERAIDLGKTRSIAHSEMDKKDFSNQKKMTEIFRIKNHFYLGSNLDGQIEIFKI